MLTALETMVALEEVRRERSAMKTTGFSALDDVTGGFAPGQVWVLTGAPGQGRSTLATQWALTLSSSHALRTHLISPRESSHAVAARLVASAGRVPALRVWSQALDEADHLRVDRARDLLTAANLLVYGPDDLTVLDTESSAADLPDAEVIDDADLSAGSDPRRIAALASRGVLVILTVPRHVVLSGNGLDPAWARAADFIIDIHRPDFLDPHSERPGEADLILLRNRWGPTRSAAVIFQGHYARFVEMAT